MYFIKYLKAILSLLFLISFSFILSCNIERADMKEFILNSMNQGVQYTVTLTQPEHGSITANPAVSASGNKFDVGSTITFTANPDTGYTVENWSGATPVPDNANKATLTVREDMTVSAVFKKIHRAVLTLGNQANIQVKVETTDCSSLEITGASETTILGDNSTQTLNGTPNSTITLMGDIAKLECPLNKLTSLDVSGLTSLTNLKCHVNELTSLDISGCSALILLECYRNQLQANAFINILNSLPHRVAGDNAKCLLYEDVGLENNNKIFTQPNCIFLMTFLSSSLEWLYGIISSVLLEDFLRSYLLGFCAYDVILFFF